MSTLTSSTLTKVTRLHLVDRMSMTWLPWAVLAFTFAVNYVIFTLVPPNESGQHYTGALLSIYSFMAVMGAQAVTKFLPFALELGLSRRTYYLGTALTVLLLSAANSLVLTALWWIEGLVDGWGIGMNFFRVPGILDGNALQVFGVGVAVMVLFFTAGLWGGLIFARWRTVGLVLFTAAVVLLIVAAVWLVTKQGWWPQVGHFFADTTTLGWIGIAAGIAVVLGLGGYGTIRRVTV